MPRLALALIALLAVSCSDKNHAPTAPEMTSECQYYHRMKIAPMLPSAVQDLERKCVESMKGR